MDVKDGTLQLSSGSPPGVARGPDDVSDEIGACYLPVPTALKLDGAHMQVLAALREKRAAVIRAERDFRIDRRAIAGAIAWEMLENKPGWTRKLGAWRGLSPRSVGWGKPHVLNFPHRARLLQLWDALAGNMTTETLAQETENAGYLPRQSFDSRRKLLATPEGAIRYIAGMMAAIADLAARHGFEDIRSNPAILTNVYHGKLLREWEEHLRTKRKGEGFEPGTEMGLWVAANLDFLEEAVGWPDLPESTYAPLSADALLFIPGPTAHASAMDPEIEALDLGDTARKAAYALKQKHPNVKFTSGRRDKAGQASAMASNVALNRNWINQTYAASTARAACQKWVDDNKEKTTQKDIAEGLLGVLNTLTDAQLAALSKHLAGQAFDVQPVTKGAQAIKNDIRALSGLSKFLDTEGGLVRWHAEFR